MFRVQILAGAGDFFLLPKTFTTALEPTYPPTQWILGFFLEGKLAGA